MDNSCSNEEQENSSSRQAIEEETNVGAKEDENATAAGEQDHVLERAAAPAVESEDGSVQCEEKATTGCEFTSDAPRQGELRHHEPSVAVEQIEPASAETDDTNNETKPIASHSNDESDKTKVSGENEVPSELDATHTREVAEAISSALNEEEEEEQPKKAATSGECSLEQEKEKKDKGMAGVAVAVAAVPMDQYKEGEPKISRENAESSKKDNDDEKYNTESQDDEQSSVAPPPPLTRALDLSRQTSQPGAFPISGANPVEEAPRDTSTSAITATTIAANGDEPLVRAELVSESFSTRDNSNEDGFPAERNNSNIVMVQASPMPEPRLASLFKNRRVRIALALVAVVFCGLAIVIVLLASNVIGKNQDSDSSDKPRGGRGPHSQGSNFSSALLSASSDEATTMPQSMPSGLRRRIL